MGAPASMVCLGEYCFLGTWVALGIIGMGWIPVGRLADLERRMAAACVDLGMDGSLFYLAVIGLQPFNALPAPGLPDTGDLCGLGGGAAL